MHPKPAVFTLPLDNLLHDDDNRLSTWNSQSVTFDFDGNMTNGPLPPGTLATHTYDARNRLTSAGGSTYRYSPDGLRVEVTGTSAATFVVDPNAALSRTLMRTKGGVTTYYVYGLGLLYEETAGATKTYHFNQVGSTLAITDGSQNVTDRVEYSPFGIVTERTGTTDTPFVFNGEFGVMTDGSGLLYMRARYYNPRIMRFLNADPIGFDGGMNWYASFDNNPISNTDPDGLNPMLFGYTGPTQMPPSNTWNYGQPTSAAEFGGQVLSSYGNAASQVGALAVDLATFSGNQQKQQMFGAIVGPSATAATFAVGGPVVPGAVRTTVTAANNAQLAALAGQSDGVRLLIFHLTSR